MRKAAAADTAAADTAAAEPLPEFSRFPPTLRTTLPQGGQRSG